ncbi:MAG: ATP-binding cassette domain-containing protein [Acidimicrobiia bacterium]|nr:ATP-binding cassette domain-containing protein [Acidimicrobiia bacterium]
MNAATTAAAREQTPALSVSDLRVSFGGNHVLTGVDLDVTHLFTGLIGPNGAGKTTLFNVVSGYVAAGQGTVRLAGVDITGAPQTLVGRSGVGRTFQTPKLIGDLSVLENVLLGIDGRASLLDQIRQAVTLRGQGRANIDRALSVIDTFSLADSADLDAGSLPLGSQKIVEVCRALVSSPSLLLLDEPAAGLGRDDVERLVEPLKRWAAEHGTTVIIIEHDLELVTDLCDDVAVLHLGHIIARGTPAHCMSDPQVVEAYVGLDVGYKGRAGGDGAGIAHA